MQTPAQPAQRKDARRPAARRECHKCPYNGTGNAYCWQKCPGPADESNKGVSKVTLGGMEAEGEYIYNNAEQSSAYSRFSEPAPDATPPSPVTAELPYEVERSLVRILASMMSLTDIQLCIFRHVYLGERLESVGNTLPVRMSKQAVSKHIHALRERHPVFDRMLSQIIHSSGGVKPRAGRDARKAKAAAETAGDIPAPTGCAVQLDMFSGVVVGGIYRKGGRATNGVTRTRGVKCTPTAPVCQVKNLEATKR